ncbi:MAG: hypothetical protein JO157_02115 [Acetobacteraceae bacterium]|nr:hypothetical protein [Acetobacteraceae bacterium]
MATEKHLFMVIRRYGPPHDPRKPLEEQLDWEAHRRFMNASEASGLTRLAGPLDQSGEVLLIFRAKDEDEIERHLAVDPWTRSGILATTRIVRWNLRVGAVG